MGDVLGLLFRGLSSLCSKAVQCIRDVKQSKCEAVYMCIRQSDHEAIYI